MSSELSFLSGGDRYIDYYKIMLEIADRQMYRLLWNHQETHPIHPEGRHSADFQKVRPKLRLEESYFLG